MTWTPGRRRAAVLLAWLLSLAAAGWICLHTHYVADLSAFLPARPSPEQRVLLQQLRQGASARVMLIGIRGEGVAARADASRALAAALRGDPAFESVHNGERAAYEAVGKLLFEHRYLLSPAVDTHRFSVEGLREGIDDTLSLLGTPAGAAIKPLLWRDPTGESVRLAESMLPAAAPRIEQGVWMSSKEPRALLVATTRAEGSDLDGQAAALAALHQHFEPLASRGLTLEVSGAGVLGAQSRAQVQADVHHLVVADSIVLAVLLLVTFGSLRALGIAALPVATGVLAGVAAVSLGHGQVHGITLGFGTALIGEAVDYSIYYLVQARRRQHEPAGNGHRRWLAESWPTVRLGLFTSLAGFSALVFSDFAGLAQLGLFSIAGLLASALTTRHVLPYLAPDGAAGLGLRQPLGRATARAAAWLPRLRWSLAAASVAAAAVVLVTPGTWRGTLAALSPLPPAALALDASLRADLGASDAGALVAIEAADEATALQRAESAGERLDALVAEGALLGYESPARLLPSPALQAARRAALPDAAELRTRLAAAAEGGPLPAARLEPFVADVQAQRVAPPFTRASLAGTPLASALAAQLLPPATPGAAWTVLMNLHLAPQADSRVLQTALAGLPETRLVSIQPELDAVYASYLRGALWQGGLGAAAVLVLLGVHLRSVKRLARVVAPLAAAVVLVLCSLTLAGVALGVLHLVGLLLVVALGSNYALFFDHLHASGEQADEDTLASLLVANLTAVATFGLLATSRVPALAAMGAVVAPGALLCLVLSAAFGPRAAGGAARARTGLV